MRVQRCGLQPLPNGDFCKPRSCLLLIGNRYRRVTWVAEAWAVGNRSISATETCGGRVAQ